MFQYDQPIPAITSTRREPIPPPASTPDVLPVTAAAHEALKLELEKLRHEKHHDIPERLRVARAYGDGSNNDEYLAIMEDDAIVGARLARLEDILSRATVIAPADSHDTVAIGSSVTLYDLRSGNTVEYTIAGAHDFSESGVVSAVSPVGAALLGRSSGDLVRVQLPRGRTRELEVLAIRQPASP
jgi:transcription elongation GreA/GreB family factor